VNATRERMPVFVEQLFAKRMRADSDFAVGEESGRDWIVHSLECCLTRCREIMAPISKHLMNFDDQNR
jgi:hypothetical protein